MNIDKIWQSAVHTLDEHKATDIRVLSVGAITSIADYFLIASGGSQAYASNRCNSAHSCGDTKEFSPCHGQLFVAHLPRLLCMSKL